MKSVEKRSDQTALARKLVNRAYAANHMAKATSGSERAFHYRAKHAAISALLNMGYALIDLDDKHHDWEKDDPVIAVWFVGGGSLHIPLSGLDFGAFRAVRAQLNAPERQDCYNPAA